MADKTIPALKILRGNVGINTATPAFKIDVDGSAVFRGAAGWAGNDNQACAIYLNTAGRGVMGNFANYARNLIKANSQYVEVGQNSTLVYGIKFRVGSNAANGFMFESNISGSMTTLMNIRGNDGNVGIGVVGAPAKKLEVNFTGDDGIQIQNTGSSHASIWLDGGTGGVGGAYLRMTSRDGTNTMTHWINLQSNGNLVFRPAATGTAANQIIFNQNGSVGVGGTPPSNYKFYVNGSAHLNSGVIIGDSSNTGTTLTIRAQNTSGAPAATAKIIMQGYEGRGIGTFYEDSSYSGKEWFCGMNYSAAFGTWNVGYDASGGQAEYNANTFFRVRYTGRVEMPSYGSGTFTGTAAYKLAVDSSGNIIETAVGAGQVDGSGTANKIPLWTDGDTIGNSQITDNGTSVGINQGSPNAANKLEVHNGNVTITSGKQLISTNTYSQAPIGMLTIQGPTTGSTALTASQFGIVIGPQHTRSSTANTYYPGIVFNHLLNHSGQSSYNNAPQAYIGTRLHDTSGSERAFLVFATKSGNGTSASDVPIERMCIDPIYGSIGIGTTDPDSQMQIGRSQTTDAFNGAFIKLRPSNTTNSTGLTSITLGTSTVDNYGYSISGWRAGTDGSPYLRIQRHNNSATGTDVMVMNNSGSIGIGTTDPGYKLDVYGGDARIGTNLRLGNGSAAGNSTDPAITVSGVTTAGVYFQNSGVGFGAGSGSKYLFLSSAGNASLGGNGFFKQLGDRPYGTDNLNDYYRSNDEASFCQFYRYDSTHGHWANSSGTLTTNAPSTLTQPTSSIYSYGALFTLRSISSFRGQFYFAHSASEFYWRSGWGTNGDQNWTRIVGDRNIQSVIHNVGHISTKAGNNLTVGGSITVQPGSGDGILFLKNSGASQILRLDQNSIRTTTNTQIVLFTNGNSNQLYLSSGGNVGIGTNTPNGLLNVAGNTKIGTAGSPYSGTNVTSLTINGVYPALSLGHTSNRFTILAYSTYTNYETVSNAHHVFSGGNVGVSTTSPGATLDVKQGTATNNNKLMKVADDVLSVYKVTGLSNHTVTLTCGSYFQAEVVITANQTNGGTYNNLYIRGIWSNNHHSHHWDEIENIGSLTGSSFSIAVSANDVSNSGKLVITHTYSSGSFSQMVVRVTDLYGSAHSYSIT